MYSAKMEIDDDLKSNSPCWGMSSSETLKKIIRAEQLQKVAENSASSRDRVLPLLFSTIWKAAAVEAVTCVENSILQWRW